MANPLDLLAQAAQANQMLPEANADAAWVPPSIPSPVQTKMDSLNTAASSKQASVASAAAAKQINLSPMDYFNNVVGAATGKGYDTANEVERDLRDLSPVEMYNKYGEDEASRLMGGQAEGQRELLRADTAQTRTPTEAWDDLNVNFGQGFGAALGGLAALGSGIVSEDAGTTVAGAVDKFSKFMDENQSPTLKSRKKVMEAKSALDSRDNAALMEAEGGDTMAGLNRIGRDVLDGLDNATDDPATLASGISSALGSFMAAGPVAKGLGLASRGVLGTTSAIAATEAGGSYAQATADVMDRTHDQLMTESPMYRELIANGATPDEAKTTVANRTGLLSAAVTAPAAAAAGRLVHRFEGNPLGLGSGRQLLGNVARETAEESIQSGAGQFAQNVADQQIANENASLTEGVGRQIAEGGLYGMGMTAALGAPTVAKDGIVASGRKIAQLAADRVAGINEANEQASPVSDDTVAQAATEMEQAAPAQEEILREAAGDDVGAQTYVDGLMAASLFTPEEAPAAFNGMFDDVTTRTGAIQRLAEIVNSADEGSPDQLRAGFALYDMVNDYTDAINADPAALSELPGDHQAAQIVGQFQGLMGAIQSSPKVSGAISTVMDLIEKSEAKKAEVSAETLATPEGQQDVADVLSTAEIAPDKVDLGTAEKILYQIDQGNLTVTPRQKAALDSSVALLRAVQKADQEAVASGNADPVSLNITAVDGEKGKSLTQHAKGIMSAYKTGDFDLAADRMTDLRNFAQGMSNKVGAMNAHFAAGNPKAVGLNYEVFVGGKPVSSQTKISARPTNEGGVKFAQKIAREAGILADVYNGLVTAFPELQAEHMAVTPLADGLSGPVADVVARNKRVAESSTPAPVVKTDVNPVEKTAPAPKKVSAPVETPVAPKQQEQVPEPKVAEPIVEEATAPTEPTLKGTAAAFPTLRGGEDNLFARSFKLPKEQRTRTIGTEDPVGTVRTALKDSASFTAALGSAPKGTFTPEIAKAYKDFLAGAEDFMSVMDDNLNEFLDSAYSKSNPTTMREILEGKEVRTSNGQVFDPVRTVRGKSLAILSEEGGELVYNPELVGNAVLAGLQWFLNSDQYGAVRDTSDVAKMLGMDEAAVSDSIVESLNEGVGVTEAKRSLATKIRQYWGVQANNDSTIGYVEGIPEALAAEVLRVMVSDGMLTEKKVTLTEADGLPALDSGKPNVLTFVQLVPAEIPADSPLRVMPSAIDQAMLIEPTERAFIGEGDLPPVAQDQLRNPGVKNTAQQLEMIQNEQATPYFVNTVMAGFYNALGKDNVLKLFGAGEVDPKKTNKNHAQSMEGVNRSTVAAFDHLQGLLGQVANIGDVASTPIHYAFNMTRVARLQMLGKYNPQSNKLVREAILPTYTTLDLSSATSQDSKRFMLGVAQMLGVKVHKMSQPRSRAKVESWLTGPLAPAVEALQNWNQGFKGDVLNNEPLSDAVVDTLVSSFKALGEPLTPMALHAIMEYARLQGTKDKSAFRTAAYVEADGVTNGPINAMVLFTTGLFTPQWIKNIAKGGLFFNQPGWTVNQQNEGPDSRDLYQATTDVFDTHMKSLRQVLADDAMGTEQMNAMLHLMDLFFGKDLSFVEQGDGSYALRLERGIAKNPLTITIYGSGAGGIAAKMTKILVDAMYERMSQVAQQRADGAQSWAEAMFGPQSVSLEDAQAKMARFQDSLDKLTNRIAVQKKDGGLFFKSKPAEVQRNADPVNFTMTASQIANMQSNIRYLFVEPMRDSIADTVGHSLLSTADMLRKATQAQSIVLEHAFKAEVDALLAEKAKDPEWRASDFLTQRELDGIRKKLEHLSPLVQTENQNFFIAGSETANLDMAQFSRALDDTLGTAGYVAGPSDAGVSGIPFLNIGSGDGQMMQNISTAPNAPTGTLKIFDGMNMPLDQIESGSEVANKAVMDSWMANPLAAVHKTFSQFMSDAKLTGLSKEANLALSKALFGLQSQGVAEVEIISAMSDLLAQLDKAQLEIQARHNVMNRVSVSVDQMAAVGSPYQQTGDLPLVGTDPESLAAQLNVYFRDELAQLQEKQPAYTMEESFDDLATEHAGGARVMTGDQLADLPTVMTAEQRAVMDEVVASLAAKDYTIVYGTPDQLAAYDGTTVPADVSGMTNVGNKTIYLRSPNVETMLHELVHAATFEVVEAHYSGQSDKTVGAAVTRIERLMDSYLAQGESLTQTSEELNRTFNTMAGVVKAHQGAGRQAEALNEFMAWTLANGQLARVAQRTRVKQVRDAVVNFVKGLFGIKATAGTDLFSNLLFNSAILMHSQPSLSERFSNSVLFQNDLFGTDDRLTAVRETMEKAIGRYLQEPVRAGQLDEQSVLSTSIQNAFTVSQDFQAHGFKMTPQESSTFEAIVTALATEASLDQNAMAAAHQLYSHVMKNLSPESFMVDPTSQEPGVYEAAAEKFDVLSGKFGVPRDLAGRSSLLPSFLALATTNNEFRSILSNMDLPKSARNSAGSLDALLENFGNNMMDKLGSRMAGTSKAKDVAQAIDLLNAHMAEVINKQETFIDQMASKPGGVIDRANDLVSDGLDRLGEASLKLAKKTQRNAAGRLERAAGGIVAGFGALISNTAAGAVAEATMTSINKTKMWDSVHTLINDLVGRTDNNASIYDMIKAVRSVVQRTRQQYREDLPVELADQFSRELTKEEKASLYRSMAKTDLAALGKDGLKLAVDPAAAIKDLEKGLSAQHIAKAKQLAEFMNTGKPGQNLLRNAEAVARLLGEKVKVNPLPDIGKLDRLITLYAIDGLSADDKATLASLVQEEAKGMQFTHAYLMGQRAEELRKSTGRAKFNAYKGHVPALRNDAASIIVADDSQYGDLLKKSYTRVGDYVGSRAESGLKRGYYFIPVASRATFEQGIMQNVRQTAGGVDAATGFTSAQTHGRVTDLADVKKLANNMARTNGREPMMPVYSENGDIIAFERSLDPEVMEKVMGDQDLHKAIGQWRGRQIEEGYSQVFNEKLADNLHSMYEKDIAADPANQAQYIDLLSTKDPVWSDAASLISPEMRNMIAERMGDKLWVRRDMINDVMGYRSASIGDMWTGNSRWSPKTQEAVRNIAISAFGNNAYKALMTAERTVQQIVGDAKTLIVVKSVIVPVSNLMSNVFQLAARGVPMASMIKAFPAKTAEVEAYTKSLVRRIAAETELRVAESTNDVRGARKLRVEIQAINDSHKRMTIWPLIEAGEFSGISDAGITHDDIPLTSGRLQAYMEKAASKLPGWGSTVGRYALVTKDTALFQGLQKAVEYGDFLAKSVLFDDLTKRKGMSNAEALAKITEEYVNYDRLAGRFRGTMENLGLLWFYNFKIRSTKVALSMIRNNPVHTLIASLVPAPNLFGTVGLPTEDNIISKLGDGSLSYSVGPGQGMRSMMLNPWINLTQ